MTGASLMDFIIGLIGLAILVTLIFLGLDKISSDEQFKKIARYAIGGVALILVLYAVKGILFGGGGAIVVTGPGLIDFAIGLIILLVVLVFLYMAVDWFAPEKFREPAKFVIGALAIIVILMLAQRSLSGPGAGYRPLFGPSIFAPEHR